MQVAAFSGQDFITGIDGVGIKKGISIVNGKKGTQLSDSQEEQKKKALQDLENLQVYLDQKRYLYPFKFPEVGPEIESRLYKFLNEKYEDGKPKREKLRERILNPQSKNGISKQSRKQFKKTRKDERVNYAKNLVERKSFRLAISSRQTSDPQASYTNDAAPGKKRKAEHSQEVE